MSYSDLCLYPAHSLGFLSADSAPALQKKNQLKKALGHLYVPAHGATSNRHYSLLKETTYIPTLTSNNNGPFLPPPSSFFNIQIGCFVPLNWRLIAHTIWRCLLKKSLAFSFHSVSMIKVSD